MEKGEGRAEETYRAFAKDLPELVQIAEDEDAHENALLSLLDDERLNYMARSCSGSTTRWSSSPARWRATPSPSTAPG
jgi:hypothetical protein